MTTKDNVSTHPVAKRLRQAGITSVAVIDDAFNTPELEDLTAEIEDFWAEIVRDESAFAELNALHPGFENEDDINEELIKKLWIQTLDEEQSSLLVSCKSTLFSRQFENIADLEPLVDYLTGIGMTPSRLGTDDDFTNEELKLVFLDFFLESAPTRPSPEEVESAIRQFVDGTAESPAMRASIDKAKEILKRNNEAFIILMSSKENVQMAKERFRQETGLIEGMFDYIPKEQLASERDLNLRLGTSAASLPARHDIQNFVISLEASIQKASKEFIDRIKKLSFEDYLYTYSLSLREEGHPLGDYMSKLYGSSLAHLVHNNAQVIEAKDKLDKIDIEAYVPWKTAPSNHLAEMYSLSLTEPGTSSNTTQLRLGDLYVSGTKNVLLVINADCDLARLPSTPDSQSANGLSILLHPGCLVPIEEKVQAKYKVTNLVFLKEKPHKIVWDYDGVFTKKYSELEEWLDSEGYSKEARLITPHALQIQQHYAANLTRVGMPVATPFLRPATVQVFAKKEDGTLQKLGPDIPQGVVIDRNRFRFTVEGFGQLLERVAEIITQFAAIRDSYAEGSRNHEKQVKRIGKLDAWLQDPAEWFALIESSNSMPKMNKGSQIGSNGILEVFCTSNLERTQCIIAINLLPDE